MRWGHLSANEPDAGDARAAPPLPLALPGSVARTFDTPGFAGMTFYEVRAKSIINRVPAASRVPFEWTINPYRGCSHACVYCLAGDTEILMADGRTRPLAEVRTGDQVYGTIRVGASRRYSPTPVLAHWSVVKPAYRISLQDGTELVASADHRFLTDRGWKYVTGEQSGPHQRPHLTTANRLMGTGRFAPAPQHTGEYRRGYLCGLIRGDAHIGSHSIQRPGRATGETHRFRLVLADAEALERAERWLLDVGIPTTRFTISSRMPAIRTSTRSSVAGVRRLIGWPDDPDPDWRRGFLAGIYDADGSYAKGVLRISATDPTILGFAVACLNHFGFEFAVDTGGGAGASLSVRVQGGLAEHLRFFHTTDPAISRKRTVNDATVRSTAKLAVTAVRPLGIDIPMFDMTTGTGDFIANGVVSHNCFARHTHSYLDLDTGLDFDRRIIVKVNAGDLARKELAATRWAGAHIAMGTNVDCYQRAEGRYRLMREILAALRDFANPFSILTKGTLILRDLDLLRQAAAVTRVSLSLSIGSVDERLWRQVEPGTPSPRRRLDVVRRLTDAGFAVGVLVAPILPGLSDDEESIEATVAALAEAGAASATPIPLHLRPGAREWYAGWLARTHPELVPRYRALFGRGSYSPAAYQREVTARVREAARRHGIGSTEPGESRAVEIKPEPEQLTLL
jgi:DNA repair photolyase